MSVFLFASFFFYYYLFSYTWRRQFSVESASVSLFSCVSSYRRIHFPRSVISFVNITSSCSLIPQKKNVFFYSHENTRVVVLYTSLRLVEGVYKPQRACVGWASVTESCLEACMWIKRTCLDEFPPSHPKMFERTLDLISLFVLAVSNTINLFPSFWYCSPWKG